MKKYVLIFIVSFLLFVGIMVLRGGYVTILGVTGFKLSSIAGFLCLLAWTLFSLLKWKQLKPGYVLLSAWLGLSILELPNRLIDFESSLVSLPSYLLWCWGIFTGYLLFLGIQKRTTRLLFIPIASTCLIGAFWSVFYGYDLFLHKLAFGTFSGKTEQVIDNQITFTNTKGEPVGVHDFKGKYLILDFWSSSCGWCIKAFPHVQELYDKMASGNETVIASVFCFGKDESIQTGLDMIQERGFSFPCLATGIKDPILLKIGVDGFPTVIIFNPEGTLIFRGNIESASSYINELIN